MDFQGGEKMNEINNEMIACILSHMNLNSPCDYCTKLNGIECKIHTDIIKWLRDKRNELIVEGDKNK